MKLPRAFSFLPPLLCLLGLLPPSLSSAPAPSPGAVSYPPGTREVYGGSVCEYADGADGNPDSIWGSIQLVVVDGAVSGRFTFPAPSGTTTSVTTNCQGYLDPVTNRGFLKFGAANGTGASEKVALLLRQSVLTGGTMEADGRVLAFRLERFLVVLP